MTTPAPSISRNLSLFGIFHYIKLLSDVFSFPFLENMSDLEGEGVTSRSSGHKHSAQQVN